MTRPGPILAAVLLALAFAWVGQALTLALNVPIHEVPW
jgi:hypothetical protein